MKKKQAEEEQAEMQDTTSDEVIKKDKNVKKPAQK